MNKKICVVGTGRWGKNHLKTLQKLGCLAGFVEVNPGLLSKFKAEYPKVKAFNKLDDALKLDFDGYTLATPAQTHFELASKIINQRKPVLV